MTSSKEQDDLTRDINATLMDIRSDWVCTGVRLPPAGDTIIPPLTLVEYNKLMKLHRKALKNLQPMFKLRREVMHCQETTRCSGGEAAEHNLLCGWCVLHRRGKASSWS